MAMKLVEHTSSTIATTTETPSSVATEATAATAATEATTRLLNALRNARGPLSRAELVERAQVTDGTLRAYLPVLTALGLVEISERGSYQLTERGQRERVTAPDGLADGAYYMRLRARLEALNQREQLLQQEREALLAELPPDFGVGEPVYVLRAGKYVRAQVDYVDRMERSGKWMIGIRFPGAAPDSDPYTYPAALVSRSPYRADEQSRTVKR